MRLNRPGIWFLNPFRISATPNDVSYGNPDLSTEKSHSISLSYNIFTSKVNLNADARYSFVNNGVTGYSFVDEDGVRNSTYGNYVRTQRTSLSVWMSWNITDKTSFMLSASGSYVDLRSKELGSSNCGFGGNLYAQLRQRLPWKLDFTAYGGYGAPYISLQGRSGHIISTDFRSTAHSLKKTVWRYLSLRAISFRHGKNIQAQLSPTLIGSCRITRIMHAASESACHGGLAV